MCEEIFKDIPNYIGLYQVSNMGNVKSLSRKGCVSERYLKQHISDKGYKAVNLHKDKQRLKIKTHKLIQSAFDMGSGCIDHINGVRHDNRLGNLRVVTPRQNSQNKVCHRNGKLVGASLKSREKNFKKPWQSVIQIKGKRKFLGRFTTELEAHQRYMAECRLLDEF